MIHKFAASAVLSLASITLASAVTIDNFNTLQTLQIAAGGVTPVTVSNNVATGANSLGGTRGMTLERSAGIGSTDGLVNAVSLLGALQLNSDTSTTANLSLVWDGGGNTTLDAPGFAGVDFTDAGSSNRVRLGILSADLGFTITLRAYTTVPGAYHQWIVNPAPGPSTQDLFFATATSIGGASGFSAITAVEMSINTPTAGDIAIDFLETFGTPTNDPVPEPSTFALAGAGLVLAGLWRRNR
ncbi:MAG: PEP-CTERM sorting domain-containing protein [Bryobacteraceae bacterium]|nr:PEP-CTERM sorting domain-containing protein [Bryobacteraceae bacterium]